jgi:adenylosuccinate synthase
MLLAFELNDITIDNVFFLETRNNIIMDGKFTKIIYSDENVVTNGIYMNIDINEYTFDKSYSRISMKHTKNNDYIINKITEIENYILKYFKHINSNTKQTRFLLKEQLDTLFIKVYRDNYPYPNDNNIYGKIVLKISGVWEDNCSIGITYKLMETFTLT